MTNDLDDKQRAVAVHADALLKIELPLAIAATNRQALAISEPIANFGGGRLSRIGGFCRIPNTCRRYGSGGGIDENGFSILVSGAQEPSRGIKTDVEEFAFQMGCLGVRR